MKKLLLIVAITACTSLLLLSQCESGTNATQVFGEIANDHRHNNAFTYGMISYQIHDDNYYYDSPENPVFYLGYGKALWASALDASGNLLMSANTYPQEGQTDFLPGPLDSETGEPEKDGCSTYNRVWIVREIDLFLMRTLFEQGALTTQDIPRDILEWPAKGNPNLDNLVSERDIAPFFDNNVDGNYNPLDGDYPLALEESPDFIPHEFSFIVYNDRGSNAITRGTSIGLEIHQTNYLVNCLNESEAEKTVFTRLKYNYYGRDQLSELKLALFEDNDMACNQNDYAGCDLELNCSYFYNESGETFQDECHDPDVPNNNGAIRSTVFLNQELKTFKHWFLLGIGDTLAPGIDPSGPLEFSNYMNGLWRDGTPMTPVGLGYDPSATETTPFAYADRPTDADGWSMQTAALNIPLDVRTLSLLVDERDVQPGATGIIDLADHFLYDPSVKRLDVFEQWTDVINSLKSDFDAMKDGSFDCGNGLEFCAVDCVWPGDANNDAVVNGKDILTVGILAGLDPQGGVPRGLLSTEWFGFNSDDWSFSLGGLNAKNGDVNGSGTINISDLEGLIDNYGNTRAGYNPRQRVLTEVEDAQGLGVAFEVDTVFLETAQLFDRIVNTEISIGDEDGALEEPLYGLSFDMQFDTNLVTPFVRVDNIQSSLFEFGYGDMPAGERDENLLVGDDNIQYAFTQVSGEEAELGGSLVTQNLIVKETARTANPDGIDTLVVRFFNVCAINAMGDPVELGVMMDTLIITGLEFDPSVISSTDDLVGTIPVELYPNPVIDQLNVSLPDAVSGRVDIYDLSGARVMTDIISDQKVWAMDASGLTEGMYVFRLVTREGEVAVKKFLR